MNPTDLANKTDAELRFIVQDAAAAAQAVDSHDEVAASKYLDQMLDAMSELRRRSRSG
jgi:hypothetical protein